MARYFIFYKPYQVLCQFSPEGDKRTLADFFKNIPSDIYPVGRLDYDSEGLLVLTNDKHLTAQLLEPRFAHQRTYYVQVEGVPDEHALQQLSQGVVININGTQYKTKAAHASLLEAPQMPERNPPIRVRKSIPDSWLALTLTEGKNRQVRKMTAAAGFPTLRLVRYSIGAVTIEGLEPGVPQEVNAAIISKLLRK
jgi:23S rRNA pseudouridine2457 synthase